MKDNTYKSAYKTKEKKPKKFVLKAKDVRQGIILSEILGKPKGLQ